MRQNETKAINFGTYLKDELQKLKSSPVRCFQGISKGPSILIKNKEPQNRLYVA
jgi:hypothetical protein